MGKLTIQNIVKRYPTATVVDNVSIEVKDGELLTIVGPSGCGKTTMLRMVAGFIVPTEGKITLDDKVLFDSNDKKLVVNPEDRDIGMVFQSYAVWPHMNVFDNVAYPLKLRKMDKKLIHEKVMATLKVVHLGGYEKRMAYELSGGQQQRVALARALVMKPKLLLLDEPLSNLDAALREEMRSEIKEIQRTLGITIINVTHDQIEAMTMSDKVAVMKDGHLIQFASPEELYERPVNSFVAKFIGSANIIPATRDPKAGPDADGMMEVVVNGCYKMKVPYKDSKQSSGFIGVRAHHLVPDSSSNLKSVVRRKLYQGNQYEYYLDLDNDVMSRMLTDVDFSVDLGANVHLKIMKAVWLDD